MMVIVIQNIIILKENNSFEFQTKHWLIMLSDKRNPAKSKQIPAVLRIIFPSIWQISDWPQHQLSHTLQGDQKEQMEGESLREKNQDRKEERVWVWNRRKGR